jgi:hypothetical protein
MQFITATKLQELEKQRLAYEEFVKTFNEAHAATNDLPSKVELLLKAVRTWPGSGAVEDSSVIGGNLNLSHLDLWLEQARRDPNFSHNVAQGWIEKLEMYTQHIRKKFDCAKLFGNLFNEWLASDDSVTSHKEDAEPHSLVNTNVTATLQEQKERLTAVIFEPKNIEIEALIEYISGLFSGEAGGAALEEIRDNIKEFGSVLQRKTVTTDDVRWTIVSILASDLMNETKRETLREINDNTVVIDEVASVLNMRLATLASWSWPASGLITQVRRHANWKYRAFSDPEVIDALFLQYLGIQWQIKFREAFLVLFHSKAWKSSKQILSKQALERRRLFLNESEPPESIETHRKYLQEEQFLVAQLCSGENSNRSYDEGPNAQSSNPFQSKAASSSINQQLLHMMVTDCYLNKALHGEHTIVQTDLEWFGPALPHLSILTLLEFFGVPEVWLNFFRTFLRAPLRFNDEMDRPLRTRERGTPISYALSALMGEVVLFGMDFAVNQRANGMFLYRIHDDIWFWDANPTTCVAAWKEMNTYSQLVGLKFKQSASGSACIGGKLAPELPVGDVRWQVLLLDSAQGRFVIDQTDVSRHIEEMRRQLTTTQSVFGFVSTYNKYVRFLVRGFGGRPAACLGVEHVDDMIDTLVRIQQELFPASEGSGGPIGHLRTLIETRYQVTDLPDGYFYFPIGAGGLQLVDPLVELFAVRPSIRHSAQDFLCEALEEEQKAYQRLKEKWETSTHGISYRVKDDYGFMSYEEFVSARESADSQWCSKYQWLLSTPDPISVTPPPAISEGLDLSDMSFYENWIVAMFGEEVVRKFGGLEIVDPTMIPVGMVELFRNSKMRWKQ